MCGLPHNRVSSTVIIEAPRIIQTHYRTRKPHLNAAQGRGGTLLGAPRFVKSMLALVVLALLAAVMFQRALPHGPVSKEMTYAEFYRNLNNGKVAKGE